MPHNCSTPSTPRPQKGPSKSGSIPAGIRHGSPTVPVHHQLQSMPSDVITRFQRICPQPLRKIKPEWLLRRPPVHATVNLMPSHRCKNASVRSVLSQQAAKRLLKNDLDVVFESPPHQRSNNRRSSIGHARFLVVCVAGSTQRSARVSIVVERSRGKSSRHITKPSLARRLHHKQPSATHTLQLPPCQLQPSQGQNVFTRIKINPKCLSTPMQPTSSFRNFAGGS